MIIPQRCNSFDTIASGGAKSVNNIFRDSLHTQIFIRFCGTGKVIGVKTKFNNNVIG